MRDFDGLVGAAKDLFDELIQQEILSFDDALKLKDIPGIYVFYEKGAPVYVGRTRKLRQRLRAHVSDSHNSASYALKRTRAAHGLAATYTKSMSRSVIANEEPYRQTFLKEIAKIGGMGIQFLEVQDPIEQYLLELLASLNFEVSLSGFDTS